MSFVEKLASFRSGVTDYVYNKGGAPSSSDPNKPQSPSRSNTSTTAAGLQLSPASSRGAGSPSATDVTVDDTTAGTAPMTSPRSIKIDEQLCYIAADLRPQVQQQNNRPWKISVKPSDIRHVAALYKHTSRVPEGERDAQDKLVMEIVSWFTQLTELEVVGAAASGVGEAPCEVSLTPLFPHVSTLSLRGVIVISTKGTERTITTLRLSEKAQISPMKDMQVLCNKLHTLEVHRASFGKLREIVGGTSTRIIITQADDISSLRDVLETPPVPLVTSLSIADCVLHEDVFSPSNLSRPALGSLFYKCEELTLKSCVLSDGFTQELFGVANTCFQVMVKLDLSFNKLTNCEFLQNPSFVCLEYVDLANNSIQSLTGALGPWLNNIKTFRIENNRLNSWEETSSALGLLPRLQTIALKGNPIYDNGNNASDPRSMFLSYYTFPNQERCSEFLLDDVKLSFGETLMARVAGALLADDTSSSTASRGTRSNTVVKKRVTVRYTTKTKDGTVVANTSLGEAPPATPRSSCDAESQYDPSDITANSTPLQQPGVTPQDTLPTMSLSENNTQAVVTLRALTTRLRSYPSHVVTAPEAFEYDYFSNGIVICAVLHSCDATWIDLYNLRGDEAHGMENTWFGFTIAAREFELSPPVPNQQGVENFLRNPELIHRYVASLLLCVFDRQALLFEKTQSQTQYVARLEFEIERYRKQRAKDRTKLKKGGGLKGQTPPTTSIGRNRGDSVMSYESVSPTSVDRSGGGGRSPKRTPAQHGWSHK